MERQAVFLDIDGTLCNYKGIVPPSAIAAVRSARQAGHLVVLCTGRSRAEIYPDLWDIGVDGLIGGNGNYVEFHEKVLLHQLISAADAREIVDWLHERVLEFFLESNNGLFASEHLETAGEPVIRAYAEGKGQNDAASLTVREAFPEMIFDGELYRDDLNKVSFILKDFQDFQDAAARFPHLKAGTWGGKGEHALFGDLGVAGISKATAMQVFIDHAGITAENTIAFGDATVDIPMFEFARTGVAMGNAGDGAKEAADMVTDDVDADGLAHALRKLGLI